MSLSLRGKPRPGIFARVAPSSSARMRSAFARFTPDICRLICLHRAPTRFRYFTITERAWAWSDTQPFVCQRLFPPLFLPLSDFVTVPARCHHNASRLRQAQITEDGPKTAELVGKSGRRYFVKPVLQEKGIPPRRVYLATYVFPKLNCQQFVSC
jgi:hypothetical protein